MFPNFPSPPNDSVVEKPFQFTLRQLVILMGLCSVAFAVIFQWGLIGFVACYFLAAIGAMIFGRYLLKSEWRWMGIGMLVLRLAIGCLIPAVNDAHGTSARRMQCLNNLQNLAEALRQYESATGKLPPPYIADANGKPMHSWRIFLLPYLERDDLYQRYNFNEPWDGPNNSKLHSEIIKIFSCPCCRGKEPATETNYVAVVGPETMWQPGKRNTLAGVSQVDGTSNTLLLVEVHGSGIHWMEPRDLDFATMPTTINPKTGLGISSLHPDAQSRGEGANVVFADSHTKWLDNDTLPVIINAILTANGRERIPLDWEY